MIYEETKHIEETGEPGNDKDDVQRFADGVVFHEFKSNACCWLGFLACCLNFLDDSENLLSLVYFRNVCQMMTSRGSEKR